MEKIKELRKDRCSVPWHWSLACALLKVDIDNNTHIKLTVKQLFLLQESYHKHFAIGELCIRRLILVQRKPFGP